MSGTSDDLSDLDPQRAHSQEAAEGDDEPGEGSPTMPHAEDPSEGADE